MPESTDSITRSWFSNLLPSRSLLLPTNQFPRNGDFRNRITQATAFKAR
jgi:hypothetical protein